MMDKTALCAFAIGLLMAVSAFAQQQPHRIRVDEDTQKAKLVRVVSPVYPPLLGKRMDGTVVLHVIVDKNGSVKSARPVSGLPNLWDSAVTAVLKWKYNPTLVNGVAVDVDTTVSVVFPPLTKLEPAEHRLVQTPPQNATTPLMATRGNSDAKEVVERFCKIETEGKRLTPEGWQEGRTFFVHSSPFPGETPIFVIGKTYTVWDPMVLPDGTTEVIVEIDPIGQIDSKLRFRPHSHIYYKNGRHFKLMFSDKRWEAGAKEYKTKEVIEPSPQWLIDEPDDMLMLSINAAVQYVSQKRDRTAEPLIKKNVDDTIAKLKPFR